MVLGIAVGLNDVNDRIADGTTLSIAEGKLEGVLDGFNYGLLQHCWQKLM